ncbi:MAG: DUF3857 and transglutaminase domain-containing protein [Pyrinomonadaceae bacterium]
MDPVRSRISFCLILAYLFVCSPVSVHADDDPWLPVNPAELAQKAPIVEKDADAEYVLWEVKVDDKDSEDLALKYNVRIKIFTDRGREQFSKIDLVASPRSKIKDVKARVIKPDGSIVEINQADIFERLIVKVGKAKIKAKSFAVPGIEPGVMVEYRYKEVFSNTSAVMDLPFQKEIPVQTLTYAIRPNAHAFPMQFQRHNMANDVRFVDEKDKFRRITVNNVPAFHEEPQMPPENEVRPYMAINYSVNNMFSGEFYWALLSRSYAEGTKDYVKVNDEVKRTAAEVTSGVSTDEERIARIYDFCQTRIRNLTYDTSMTAEEKEKIKDNKNPGDTLKRQVGWSRDVNFLLIALARAAGIDATMAITGNRSENFFNRSIRDANMVHFASAAARIGNEWRFFDPGSRFVPYGMLVWWEEDQDALLIDSKMSIWARTPLSPPERSVQKRTGKFKLSDDGTLEGEVRLEYTGHFSYEHKRDNYEDSLNQQEETLKDEIKEQFSTAEVTEIHLENVNEPKKDFAYAFKIKIPGYAQRTGKRLFVQPGFFEHSTGAQFTASERKYDVYFEYPWADEDDVIIELPPGFAPDNAEKPAPILPASTQGVSGLDIKISLSPDKRTLTYHRSFFFGGKGNILFPKANYAPLKQLFEMIRKADDHAIAFKQP